MITIRKSAIIGGLSILFVAVAAAFTFGYVHNTLVIPGNPENTVRNINASGLLFKAEILGWALILSGDVIVAWALYIFFKNDNPDISFHAAGLRTIYAAILGVAIFNLIRILHILDSATTANAEIAMQKVMLYLNSFEKTWSFGLIIFGFHLLLLGFLALQSKATPSSWGVLLVIAALSYITIHSSKIGFPEFDGPIKTAEKVLSLPMAFGEIGFAFWLIFRGGKPKTISRPMKIGEDNQTVN